MTNDKYKQDLAQRIVDLVFDDPRMTELYKKAVTDAYHNGEVSKEALQEAEALIREIISEWEV